MRHLPLLAAAILLVSQAAANAAPIAADQFIIDDDPDGYTAGADLAGNSPQGPNTTGMTSNDWDNGIATTGLFDSDGTGLDYAATDGEAGGSALWVGAATGQRSVTRLLDSGVSVSSGQEYWMAVMVQASGTLDTSGLVLGGFGNTDDPTDTGAASGSDDPQGYWVGVQGDGSELDLVLQHRELPNDMATDVLLDGITLDETYLVLIKSIVNGGGGSVEDLSVWVNPTDVSSEAALGTPVSGLSTDQALFGTAFTQLTFYSDSLDMEVRFDEMALGTSLSDVVTAAMVIPEPGSLVLMYIGGLGVLCGRRRRQR